MAGQTNQKAGFAAWFRRELTRREMSPADFANEYHFDTGSISRYLNGSRNPSPKVVDRIADALRVDVNVALIAAGHKPPDITIDPNSPEARLLPLIRAIPWTERDLYLFEEQLRLLGRSLRGELFKEE